MLFFISGANTRTPVVLKEFDVFFSKNYPARSFPSLKCLDRKNVGDEKIRKLHFFKKQPLQKNLNNNYNNNLKTKTFQKH